MAIWYLLRHILSHIINNKIIIIIITKLVHACQCLTYSIIDDLCQKYWQLLWLVFRCTCNNQHCS